jgi:hypothetical protein
VPVVLTRQPQAGCSVGFHPLLQPLLPLPSKALGGHYVCVCWSSCP